MVAKRKKPLVHFSIGDFIDKKESGKWKRAGTIVGFDGKTVSVQKKGGNQLKTNFAAFIGKIGKGEYRITEKRMRK